jgi:hypothetical protein
MFFIDYSMSAMELARALEERGFESVWAPEHSHIPLSRKTPFPGGGDLPKQYYDAMDPFVVLAAASQVTRTIKLGTGVLLVMPELVKLFDCASASKEDPPRASINGMISLHEFPVWVGSHRRTASISRGAPAHQGASPTL